MIDVPATADHLDRIEGLLRQLVDDQGTRWPEWMGIATAARYSDLSEASIRRLISSGKITAHRILRGKISIERRELDDVIRIATGSIRVGRGLNSRK